MASAVSADYNSALWLTSISSDSALEKIECSITKDWAEQSPSQHCTNHMHIYGPDWIVTSVITVNSTSSIWQHHVKLYIFLWPSQNPLHSLQWYFSEDWENPWELKLLIQTLSILTQLLQKFYGCVQLLGSFSITTVLDIWIACCILHLHFVQHRNERICQSIWETIIFKRTRWNLQIKQDILLAPVLQKQVLEIKMWSFLYRSIHLTVYCTPEYSTLDCTLDCKSLWNF